MDLLTAKRRRIKPLLSLVLSLLLLSSCTTTFIEFRGECVLQQWKLVSVTMRQRQICDLPPPQEDPFFNPDVDRLRDREAMEINPFPDLGDRLNKADSMDPNLLEKSLDFDPNAPIDIVE